MPSLRVVATHKRSHPTARRVVEESKTPKAATPVAEVLPGKILPSDVGTSVVEMQNKNEGRTDYGRSCR